jgi:hypothetical protein
MKGRYKGGGNAMREAIYAGNRVFMSTFVHVLGSGSRGVQPLRARTERVALDPALAVIEQCVSFGPFFLSAIPSLPFASSRGVGDASLCHRATVHPVGALVLPSADHWLEDSYCSSLSLLLNLNDSPLKKRFQFNMHLEIRHAKTVFKVCVRT